METDTLGQALGLLSDGAWHELDENAKRVLAAHGVELQNEGKRTRWPGAIELLDGQAIAAALDRPTNAAIERLDVHFMTDSTNSLLQAAPPPAPGRTHVCLAEFQRAGRGRRGNEWIAPFGSGICVSLAWSFARTPAMLSALSLAVGAGIVDALSDLGLRRVGLKWPNDLVVDDHKLGGMLIDAQVSESGTHVVTGLGLNVRLGTAHATGIGNTALPPIAVRDLDAGLAAQRNRIAAAVIGGIVAACGAYDADPAGWREAWARHDALAGRVVEAVTPAGRVRGLARGVDEAGALLIDVGGATQRLLSGEVTVRPI